MLFSCDNGDVLFFLFIASFLLFFPFFLLDMEFKASNLALLENQKIREKFGNETCS